jgi:hypothetical protein
MEGSWFKTSQDKKVSETLFPTPPKKVGMVAWWAYHLVWFVIPGKLKAEIGGLSEAGPGQK